MSYEIRIHGGAENHKVILGAFERAVRTIRAIDPDITAVVVSHDMNEPPPEGAEWPLATGEDDRHISRREADIES